MNMLRTSIAVTGLLLTSTASGFAQQACIRNGNAVACNDGRTGLWTGDAIVWPDGTRSNAAGHPSVIIGHKPSVHVGQGVFVGQGKGKVPLDDPNKKPCVVLDGVAYCN